MLNKFKRVVGIDWDKFAIAAGKENATEKETYIAGDVEEELQQKDGSPEPPAHANDLDNGRSGSIAPTTIIVDPPAIGLSVNVRNAILDLAPTTLIYVSCNPATLARDLKELQEKIHHPFGYPPRHVSADR